MFLEPIASLVETSIPLLLLMGKPDGERRWSGNMVVVVVVVPYWYSDHNLVLTPSPALGTRETRRGAT